MTRHRKTHWISRAFNKHKKGTLHFLLDVPTNKKIPLYKLKQATRKSNPLHIRRMAQLVLNVKKSKKKKNVKASGIGWIGKPNLSLQDVLNLKHQYQH